MKSLKPNITKRVVKKLRSIKVNGVEYIPDKPFEWQALNFIGDKIGEKTLKIYIDDGRKKRIVTLRKKL